MKYKVGDRVKVHSKEWFDNNCDKNDLFNTYGNPSRKDSNSFVPDMQKLCGQIVTIKNVRSFCKSYLIREDSERWNWEDWMFEDTKTNNTDTIYNPNVVEDFAKLIGVELDEEFYDSKGGWRYKFIADSGLMVYDDTIEDWRVATVFPLVLFLTKIKEGTFIKKWKPKDGDTIYFPAFYGKDLWDYKIYDNENEHDKEMVKNRLYFRTQEEAIECAKKIIKQMKEG